MDSVVSVGSSSKIKKGAIFSFAAIVFEILVNFFLLRYLTKGLGSDYGLYTLALNTISIFLVDFGLGQSITKFLSKYRLNNDIESENKFLGLILKIYLFIDVFIIIACLSVFFCIPFIYKGLTPIEQSNFKVVFIIVSVYSCISFPLLPLNGILQGHEEFSSIKILSMVQKGFCTTLLAICLFLKLGLYSVVFVNVLTAFLISIIKLIIVFKKCKIKPNIKHRDKTMLKQLLAFTLWIAISSLASRLSLSIMPTILATVQNSSAVAVFGIAITLETYAYLFSTAISGLFLPKITKHTEEKDFESLNNISCAIGKFQMIISGLITVGFLSFGKEFLSLYLEPMYGDAYLPTLLLFVCVIFQSTLLIPQTISFAMGTIKYASIIELIISVIRLGLCWLFARLFGIVGLSLCYLIMELLLCFLKLFFVYYRKQNLNIKKFLVEVYLKSLPTLVISIALGFLLKKAFYSASWIHLIICCLGLVLLFLIVSFLIYLNPNEKSTLLNAVIKKIPFGAKIQLVFNRAAKRDHLVPSFLCFFLIALSLFSSNYPITKIALAVLVVFFSISLFLYIYFCISNGVKKGTWISKQQWIKNISLWFVLVFSFLIFVSFIQTKSFEAVFGTLKILIIMWSAFLFVEIFSFKTFFKVFRLVFFSICCLSLFMTLLILINGGNFSPTIENGAYYNYYFLFFSLIKTDSIGRNCAIFWEPGIFASFCCIALAMEILFDKEKWFKQVPFYIVFILSLISSGSLAGYILSVILLPLFLIRINTKVTRTISWLLIITFILAFLLFIPLFDVIAKIIPAIQNKGTSLTTRIYALFVDIEVFKMNPIFGVGSQYNRIFTSIANEKYHGLLDTSLNTFGYYLGAYGFLGIVFFVAFVYSILFSKQFDLQTKIVLLFLSLLIFSKEPHTLSLLSMIFFFYFLKGSDPFVSQCSSENDRIVLGAIVQEYE